MNNSIYAVYSSITYASSAYEALKNKSRVALVHAPQKISASGCLYAISLPEHDLNLIPKHNLKGVYKKVDEEYYEVAL